MALVTTSGAKLGQGTTLARYNGAAYIKIGDCQNVPPVGVKRPLVKVTPSDAAGEIYIGGMPDGMELTVAFNYDSTNAAQESLIQDCENNVTNNLQASVPAASTKLFTFSAIHLGYEISSPKDGQQVLTAHVKINGTVART